MLSRLWRLVSLSLEQKRTVDSLWQSDGTCVCGAGIRAEDDKICLAQVNTSWTVLKGAQNTLAIGIYCSKCASLINMCLKNLKPLPEEDKLKRRPFVGQ